MIGIVTAINVWALGRVDLQNWTTLVKVGIIIVLSALLLSFGHHARDIPPAFGAVQRGVACGPISPGDDYRSVGL